MKLSSIRLTRNRAFAVVGVGGIVAAAVGVLPANAAVNFTDAAFSGSASGESIHVDALSNAVAVDVARSSAAVNSKGLTAAASDPATLQPINPALPTKNAYGYGKGLDAAGIALADEAVSSAPPNGPQVLNDVQVPVSPLIYASLTRGVSNAKWAADTCVLGSDISKGVGYVADAQLIGSDDAGDLGLVNPIVAADTGPNTKDVIQTLSRTTVVPNSKGAFGLRSQVATTLVPITLFKGTPTELTIQVAGDWILTATATGVPGESSVAYRPATDSVDPTIPLLTIIQSGLPNQVLKLGDLLAGGLSIPISPLINIDLGKPATKTVSADGTTVSGSADVLSVQLLPGAPGTAATGANIRVGHAQVKATVPVGGFTCPIPVSKKATPSIINSTTAPDGKFQVAITIKNSFDCDLINVSATDEIIRKSGNLTFKIEENDTRNDPKKGAGATYTTKNSTSATASYGNLGTIKPGESKILNVVISVPQNGTSGEIQDTATAKGTLNCAEGSALGKATIDMNGSFTLITVVSKVLARTGGTATAALLAGGVAMAAVVTRRVMRSRKTA